MSLTKDEITAEELSLIQELREKSKTGDGEAYEELVTLSDQLVLPKTELEVLEAPKLNVPSEEEDPQQEEWPEWFLALSPREQRILYKQAEALGSLIRNITFFEGKKGRGKSLACLAMAYQMREFYSIKPVVIGTSMDMTEAFGPYTYLDEREFIANLDAITKISKNSNDTIVGNAVEKALDTMGISILNSLLIFDEAYKLFDARTPSDKLVRVFGYFIAQSRHYKCTIFMTSPNRDMLDKRIRRQIDYFGRCFTNKKSHITSVRIRGGADSWKMRIFGPNYYPMYNSWNILGFRPSSLKIGEI